MKMYLNNFKNFPITKLTPDSQDYTILFKDLKDPPKELYYRGFWDPALFKKSLAIVGSRRFTSYGERVLDLLIPALVANGITIISGFMYGIDTLAHQKTLECGGKTVAVLGGGLNVLYPPENEGLYEQIVGAKPTLNPSLEKGGQSPLFQGENPAEPERGYGLIISEYPPDQQPQLWTFPQRNRIVAALSTLGVLVIEAGEKSGSLITAKIAKDMSKPVYAIPGPITSSASAGTNKLIKDGTAKMVLTANDLLGSLETPQSRRIGGPAPLDEGEPDKTLPFQGRVPERQVGLESKILALLTLEPLTIDDLARKLGSDIVTLSQTVTMMTLKNIVTESQGKYFLNK